MLKSSPKASELNIKSVSSPCEENFTEESPHPTTKNSQSKLPMLFEDLLEEDFQNPSLNSVGEKADQDDDDYEREKPSLALYTFKNDPNLRSSYKELKVERDLKKSPKRNLGSTITSPRFMPSTEVKSQSIKNLYIKSPLNGVFSKSSLSDQVEIQELRKIVESQRKVILENDKKCRKVVEEYEKKISDLESQNFLLMKQLGSARREGKRPLSGVHASIHRKRMSAGTEENRKPEIQEKEKEKENEKSEVVFNNGTRSEMYPNGYKVLYYPNGDIKQEHPDGMSIYFFANEQTTKTTFKNGVQVIKFGSGQTEKIFPDGTQEIRFPDGTLRCIFPSGESSTVYPNKSIEKQDKNGVKTIIHSRNFN